MTSPFDEKEFVFIYRDNPASRTSLMAGTHMTTRRNAVRTDSPWCDQDYSPTPGERRLLIWLEQAVALPGKATIRMALLVLQLATICHRKRHLMVRPKEISTNGMSRVAAYEGLRTLELAGMVTVKRCRGLSPLVTIVEGGSCSDQESHDAS